MSSKIGDSNLNGLATPVVALLSVGELFGGVERHLIGMCEWMRRQGADPLLILFHDRELASQARSCGFSPIILTNRGSFDLAVPQQLGKILKEKNVNVVHAHGYKAVVNAALAKKYHSFAVVRTVHGLVEPDPLFSVKWAKANLYAWTEEVASFFVKPAVCHVTDDLRINRKRLFREKHSFTVYNGIDEVDDVEYPRPDDLDNDVFNFAAVGRVSPVKELETVLLAMSGLDSNVNAVLNVIGTGPSVDSLKELATELALGSKVKFLGFKKNVYDYLSHIDALVMPSRHEGLPYTILEAMSVGTPIIASRVGGLAEILSSGQTAVLLKPGAIESWTEAMATFVDDRSRAEAIGAAGLAEQGKSYTLESMGKAYWKVYDQHLNGA